MKNEIKNFVNIIENKSQKYKIDEIVSICKRLNNKKRDFLFVNKYQGKHYPQEPHKILGLFDEFIQNIEQKNEKIIIIGFAETATAIGNYVAAKLKTSIYVMQTTREELKDENVIVQFKEEHSHAPSQSLYGNIEIINNVDRVLFVEDEITTGKTIINFINEINKINPNLKYAVASILNWQNDEDSKKYKELGIETYYLIKGKIKNVEEKVDANTIDELKIEKKVSKKLECKYVTSELCNFKKSRTGKKVIKDLEFYSDYIYNKISKVSNLAKSILELENKQILVIGTEEFMYEPMLFAKYLEDNTNNKIYYQATTRSPIEVSNDDNYILTTRYKFNSCYEEDRTTYLYNLKKYDRIFIITDTKATDKFIEDMSNIFVTLGCNLGNIELVGFLEVLK